MPFLYPHPLTVKFNPEGGYSFNPVTSDSTQPIVNSIGDTLKTGVNLSIKPHLIDPGIFTKPLVVNAETPEMAPIHQDVHKIPEDPTIIPVNKGSLRSYIPGKNDFYSYTLINSTGDTIPTGVPIPVKGKVVPCKMPVPVEALRPRLRENARISVKYLDVEQGMNSSYVTSIIEDSKGNLWFGTTGGGVSRYNGVSFTHFTEKEGLSNNNVTSILEDRHGNLWFGTNGGVCMYNGDSFIHYTENEGLGTNYVQALIEDRNGNIWFGTVGAGLVLFDGKTLTHFTENEGFIHRNIRLMVKDIDNNIWIGTQGGVCMYNGATFTHFSTEEGLIHPIIWSLEADKRGNVWIGSLAGGVSKYDGHYVTNFIKNKGMSDFFIKSIIEDSNGNLWFGDVVGGITKYDGKIFTYYSDKEGFGTDEVLCIMEDSYGNLWFGTGGSGVSIYNPGSSVNYTRYQGYNKGISCILEDSQANLWFGSSGGGLFRYDGEVFKRYTVDKVIGNNFIESLLQDRDGNLWFGFEGGGFAMYNRKSIAYFGGMGDHPLNHPVYSIEADRYNKLWFGTSTNGVIMLDDKLFTEFTEMEGFIDNNIKSIIEDSHGDLWFGTLDAGVSRYNGQGFTNYSEREGLGDNCVRCMFEDSHGNLWLGTENGGANMISEDSITYFTEREGLSSNSIRSVIEDNYGNIWIGTMNGLNYLTFGNENYPGKGNRNWPVIHTYNEQDGLQGMDFNDEAVLMDSRNRLWWGTGRFLTMIDMNSFKLPGEVPSHIQLDRIEINGKLIDYRHIEENTSSKMQFSGVASFYNYPLNLKLPYRYNHLTFYFSAIDWSASHKIKYSFKIDGLGDNWSIPSTETKAEYRNLPSGTFTFKVRAIGAAQKWSDPFEYTFTISPPWWYSWWAFAIYGSLFILFMLQFRRSLLKRARLKAAVEIERIEKEKVLEIDHMKSRFFANISHEFRTPLTLILGPIEGILKKKGKGAVLEGDELGIIHRNAKRLQRLINQLLDIAKLEMGKVRLQVSEGNISEYIRSIVLSFLSLAESKKINYKYDIPDIPGKFFYDQDKLEKILTNLVSNAFKFTPSGGEIDVKLIYIKSVEQDISEFIEISIRDSGIGIPADQIEKIFDRFYQVSASDTREHEGTGIGLSLTKELIDIYRGEINVESEPGKGSLFKVRLAVSRKHFKPDEIVEIVQDDTRSIKYQPEDIIEGISAAEEIHAEHSSVKDSERPVILIVEDNADLRKYISRNLKDEYQVLEAENGQNGMAVTLDEIPDLVITDLMMPVMGGLELCKRIRQDQRTNHIPVIMLTAKADKESKLEGLSTGADDYLIKPFDADELNVRVKNLIDQRKKLREKFRKEFLMDPGGPVIPPTEDEFLLRLVDCTRKHLEDSEFGVKQLGEELNLSHTQLYRKVLSLTDHTPNEYIRNYRLMTAARMFLEGQTNITSVLYTVGYNSPSYFTQSFRELFGLNPSDYIRQAKTK
jgi:signal transduction histidine kinase/ligand-binding sensor domain-containing protein/DNA-binding response OmpR family regulator